MTNITVVNNAFYKKRIIGASFFGFCFGLIIGVMFRLFPDMSLIEIITSLGDNYFFIYELLFSIFITSITAFLSSFLIGIRGLLVGFLSNSLFLFVFSIALISPSDLDIYVPLLRLIFAFIGCIFGGYLGGKYYSSDLNFDFKNDRLTIYGIRWFHYIWILPIVGHLYFNSIIYVFFVAILSLFDVRLASILLTIAFFLLYFGFKSFYHTMQYKQINLNGWKKLGKIILYGICYPALAHLATYFSYYLGSPIQTQP